VSILAATKWFLWWCFDGCHCQFPYRIIVDDFMTYTFKVLRKCKWGKKDDIVEVQMGMSEYDAFKAKHIHTLERYLDVVPAVTGTFGVMAAKLPTSFSNRLRQIEQNYPGAKGMLKDSKFNHPREF